MAVFRTFQTNFTAGELDPLMRARTESTAFRNGAQRLRNVAMLATGGVARRWGTKFTGSVLPGRSRLLKWEFSAAERYVVAFSAGTATFYDIQGVQIAQLTGCPWTADTIFALRMDQLADAMIVCHPTMATQVIRRTGLTTFSRSAFAFSSLSNGVRVYQPYYKFADDATTLTPSGATGSITLTASSAVFVSGHVGTRFRWHGTEILITAVSSSTVATGTVQGELIGRYDIDPFKTTEGSNVVEVIDVAHGINNGSVLTIKGANATGGIAAASLNGNRTITVIDANTYSFVAGANATSSATGGGTNVTFSPSNIASRTWDEQSISAVRGYPGCVCFHEGRLWLGGSPSQPDAIWASKTNQFFDFDVGDGLDTDAIWVTVGSSDVSTVQHLVSNRALQIFTATAEFAIPFLGARPVTPSTVRIQRQGTFGSALIQPLAFDGGTIFVQAGGRAVREMTYNDTQGGYDTTDLTMIAGHIPSNPVDLAYTYGSMTRNEQYAFLVNGDGSVGVFLSARAEKIAGWTLWTTPGLGSDAFESICSVGGEVFASVRRGTERWLEVFEPEWFWTLDGAQLLTAGSATTSWTLPAHYRSRTAKICTQAGAYLGEFAVPAGGGITLPSAQTSILVGWDFPVTVETMPPDVQLPNGSLYGSNRRIGRIQAIINETTDVQVRGAHLILQGFVRPPYSDPARSMDGGLWRFDEDASYAGFRMDQMPVTPVATYSPVTGVREFYALGYARQPHITVTQGEPYPMRLLGLIAEVAF